MDIELIESRNWILKKLNGHYSVLTEDGSFDMNYLKKNGILLSGLTEIIDWSKMKVKYSFNYEMNKHFVKDWLIISDIQLVDEVIVSFGHNQPTVIIDTISFIDNWNDFASWGGYEGIIILTHDCEIIIEFTDDYQYLLYSNFPIQPKEPDSRSL